MLERLDFPAVVTDDDSGALVVAVATPDMAWAGNGVTEVGDE